MSDPGIARLARKLPCVTRRWLQSPAGYQFFPWKNQPIDSPRGASWTSDDDVHAFAPPSVTLMDLGLWDSWVNGADRIGATSLTAVTTNDTLYVSGAGWTNINWALAKAGNRVQIKSIDDTILYQNWTITSDYVAQAPGGHFGVTGTLLTVPAQASQIHVYWTSP